MYRKQESSPISPEKFVLPSEIQLDENNRWVIMANLIPWLEFEQEYALIFDEKLGAPALSFRVALGALIIQQKLKTTDRETVESIKESPYLQYFIGLEKFSNKIPFDSSMMVHFRQRIKSEMIEKINRKIGEKELKKKLEAEKTEDSKLSKNKGKLILDASCTPADIAFPTDLGLLNKARKQTEKIIDILYEGESIVLGKKPRTYRERARKEYLKVAKKKKVKIEVRSEAIKKQLSYIKRNLESIDKLINQGISLSKISQKDYQKLLVVGEIYRQQLYMYKEKKKRVDQRIVSIEQPHIRPIVRGKAGSAVEFGGKISISVYENYVFLDKLSWENFNESKHLKEQVEKYYEYMGYYPESIHVDAIYRTRENRAYCKEKGIKMNGAALGRPKKNISVEDKKQAKENEKIRNRVEGKLGVGKRKYGLNKIMTKLPSASMTVIALTFLVMNLSDLYRQIKPVFWCQFLEIKCFLNLLISLNYVRVKKRKVELMSGASPYYR